MSVDLQDRSDIARLVTDFYETAFADPLIGPIFTDVAKMDLQHHLPIMCDFWETVLFNAGLYHRNTLALHYVLNARVPLLSEHFDRWLRLWVTAVDRSFAGTTAELAKVQAERMAGSMLRRMQGRSGSEFETIRVRSESSMITSQDG